MIEAEGLTVRLGSVLALDGVSFSVPAGALVAVLGPNGAGKTSLLRALAGLVPYEGRAAFSGLPLEALPRGERARQIAYLPQGHVAHWPIAARDAVAIGRLPHGAVLPHLRPADAAAVTRAMDMTGITGLANRPVTRLSGGERARVMLARALAVEAPVLLADEPTAALDPAHQLRILALLRARADEGGVVIAALHDLNLASRFATHAILLDRGRIAALGAPADVMTPRLLSRVFGIAADLVRHAGSTIVFPRLPPTDLPT